MTAAKPLNVIRPLPLRVEDFFHLGDSGAFDGYGKTELIDGSIVYMNAQHRPHARSKINLFLALRDALTMIGSPLSALVEVTVSMPPHDAPEPDIILTSDPDGDGPATLESTALVIEISDTTLVQDLGIKQRVYARHGVPEYWVVDVEGRTVHQHWSPDGDSYAQSRTLAFGEPLVAATIDGLSVPTATLG